MESRERMVISDCADALLVIPKNLAVNAVEDALVLRGQLQWHPEINWAGPAGRHNSGEPRHGGRGDCHIEDQEPEIRNRGGHYHFENR